MHPRAQLEQAAVTAAQMSAIESRVFAAGMPVAALMEKVGGLLTRRLQQRYPQARRIGVLAGPGHNGGDALVIARELHLSGCEVLIYQPFSQQKALTETHARYAASLGIPTVPTVEALEPCDLLIDGWFGFGLTRAIEGAIAADIDRLNQFPCPIVSIDLPSGIHTDTGQVLGTAVRAARTLCLGLWKLAFLQDDALAYTGTAELVEFGLPIADVQAVLGEPPQLQRITTAMAIAPLTQPHSPTTHKYKQGHLLLVCGSQAYSGAAMLAGLAARASGVGMLSIAVPQTLKPLLTPHLPEALILGCPETASGAIAALPDGCSLEKYSAIACGPGLTPDAAAAVERVLAAACPLVLDADGLNIIAARGTAESLTARPAPTLLTPHAGEFKRLFPDLGDGLTDRIAAARAAAQQSQAMVLLKGARVAIATPQGQVWVNPESTPALARGGSGDVLTGLVGGLIARAAAEQQAQPLETMVPAAVWWHAQAGIWGAASRTELGIDALTLTQLLIPALKANLSAGSAIEM